MKSGVAIFSNQGDPFPGPCRGRTHYHPSESQSLTQEQKQAVLSPVRLHPRPSEALSPADAGPPESDSSGPFDESWPSSEGSARTPEQDNAVSRVHRGADHPTAEEDSVIARYVARFRTGRPTSRLERSPPQPPEKDFWWLQTSPDSPDIQRFRPSSGVSGSLPLSSLSLERSPPRLEGSLEDSALQPEDVDIMGLHHKAGKLLLQSESFLSSGRPLSSEGSGSDLSSGISKPASDIIRVGSSSTLDTAPMLHAPVSLPAPPTRAHPTLPPEEDILYQWRLRRKMEQAREGALPLTTRRRSPSPPVRIPKQVPGADSLEQVYRVTSREAEPPSAPPCVGHVPIASPMVAPHPHSCTVMPHLHLQCDILPCVHAQPRKQETAPVQSATVPTGGSAHPFESERLVEQRQDRPPRRARRRPERPEETRPRSKGDRSRKEDRAAPARRMEATPPPSLIHQAMKQVISERLFSPPPSPKPEKLPEAAEIPAEENRKLRPTEIAAHLLEKAEDSDGTEFADDPLLQVLREQRRSLRSRLLAVDRRLCELQYDHEASRPTPPHPSRY